MNASIYHNIATRTAGDIYIGVVGPVRTGKSTFIKRFMETQVIPNIENVYRKERARDELPQSGSGRTVMTAEPKFVPEEAAQILLPDGGSFSVRLIDCVGYMVKGAMGQFEGDAPRMVTTPWYDHEIPMTEAAEVGTRKVIAEHSTIGIVVTTDGSISDIPREKYQAAEERVVAELEDINKPFVILLNCVDPKSAASRELAAQMEAQYGHTVLPISCVDLDGAAIDRILQSVLYEFDVKEIAFAMPKWITMLEPDHWLQTAVYSAAQDFAASIGQMKDVVQRDQPIQCEYLKESRIRSMQLATGQVTLELSLQPDIFYQVLGETTGLEICDEASLMPCIISLAKAKREYEKIRSAIEQVEATGYGIVMPTINELHLEEPEIVRQGGRYGVRLRASAPSIHMMRANITTEVAPIVGSESQSEELVMYLLKEFEDSPEKIWESNIFGTSLHQLVNEGLHNKLYRMPADARIKLQETIEKVINEGCSGLICIIL